MTINIALVCVALLGMAFGFWGVVYEMRKIGDIAERLDARLRRQYTDIDQELRDIWDTLQ